MYLLGGQTTGEGGGNRNITCVASGSSSSAGSASNCTGEESDGVLAYPMWQAIIIVTACVVMNIGTVIGNILVCTAVCMVRRLRTPSNMLIVSLALSDMLVSLLVMPLAIVNEVKDRWVFSAVLCDAWTSMDVLLCTASILNLCAISVDRYFVITRPFQYAMKRTPQRMALMIVGVWLLAATISIPPLFGWRTDSEPGKCAVSQSIGYQFYATIGAFYLPLIIMIVIYTRIYLVSWRIAKAEAMSQPSGDYRTNGGRYNNNGRHYGVGGGNGQTGSLLRHDSYGAAGGENYGMSALGTARSSDSTQSSLQTHSLAASGHNPLSFRLFKWTWPSRASGSGGASGIGGVGRQSSSASSSSRERKATKTLGVIMGAFTLCWLPFFIVAIVKPFCDNPETCIPRWLNSTLLWLGYVNSFLNPLIYARFNRDFRRPFKEILLLRCCGINDRLRFETYAEQYGVNVGTSPATARHDVIKPPVDTVVRYHGQGQTIIKLGNGDISLTTPARLEYRDVAT